MTTTNVTSVYQVGGVTFSRKFSESADGSFQAKERDRKGY